MNALNRMTGFWKLSINSTDAEEKKLKEILKLPWTKEKENSIHK